MLWVKISVIAVSILGASLFSMLKTGKVADLSEEVGISRQALAQKERALEQERQRSQEARQQAEAIEAQYRADMEAMTRRVQDNEQALRRANDRLARFQQLEDSSEDYKDWANTRHPDELGGLLNDETGISAPGTDHQDSGGDKVAP